LIRLRILVLPLVLLVLSANAIWAADLPVTVVSLTSPAAPFSDATLVIQTTPGATCTITVQYKSGPSRVKGLVPNVADRKGRVWLAVAGGVEHNAGKVADYRLLLEGRRARRTQDCIRGAIGSS